MSTKPFKDIEKMMRDAAEGFEMPFEEESWKKMENLLDQNPDRRRPVFWLWWLLPVLLGGSLISYFILREPKNAEKEIAGISLPKEKTAAQPTEDISSDAEDKTKHDQPVPGGLGHSGEPGPVLEKQPDPSQSAITSADKPVPESVAIKNNVKTNSKHSARQRVTVSSSVAAEDPVPGSSPSTVVKSSVQKQEGAINSSIQSDNAETQVNAPVGNPVSAAPAGKEAEKSVEKKPGETPDKNMEPGSPEGPAKNTKPSANARWYFIVAVGAEGSSPKLFAIEKVTPRAGVNIGYQLNEKISVQTGLLIGSKKYIAGPNDYNAKAGTYWSTVQIVEVNANCLVLEIPLNIRYDFKSSGSTNFFSTAGVSSYIMKKEDYDYLYNRYGYAHSAQASYKGNEHLFSVLRLGAGLERKISKTLMLNASPSVNVPLAGVGEGSVKLYSLDFMVGLKYQPLRKSTKK